MNLMLDLETMGTAPNTVTLSLGAVAFNREGIIAKELFEFDIEEQFHLGREASGSTLKWWMKQDNEARKVFEDNDFKIKVSQFFTGFESLIDMSLGVVKESRGELKPWGNGANFDTVIIEDLYRRHHEKRENAIPWKFWNVWCFRTFNNMTKCKDLVPRKQTQGVKHNALDDAIYQTNCVLAFYNKGKKT